MKQRVSSEKFSFHQGLANSKINFESIFKFNVHYLEEGELTVVDKDADTWSRGESKVSM